MLNLLDDGVRGEDWHDFDRAYFLGDIGTGDTVVVGRHDKNYYTIGPEGCLRDDVDGRPAEIRIGGLDWVAYKRSIVSSKEPEPATC